MMKEQIISFETAKLAKEKGFDVITSEVYLKNGKLADRRDCITYEIIIANSLSDELESSEELEPIGKSFIYVPTQSLS